jgi:hypothetical protein
VSRKSVKSPVAVGDNVNVPGVDVGIGIDIGVNVGVVIFYIYKEN